MIILKKHALLAAWHILTHLNISMALNLSFVLMLLEQEFRADGLPYKGVLIYFQLAAYHIIMISLTSGTIISWIAIFPIRSDRFLSGEVRLRLGQRRVRLGIF
jgi:hypothetical protein